MSRESKRAKTERATEVCRRLALRYPHDKVLLEHSDPFTLVIAVLLSAQTTDAAVNKVTPELFRRWPDPASMARASEAELGEVIRSIGFWRAKAAHCIGCAQMIVSDFGGDVPRTMEELTCLPGVGRKTANIVLSGAFGIIEGIAVDTHVYRISTRLKFTRAATPAQAEADLLSIIPRELWGPVNHNLVRFGREVCDARKPRCELCELTDLCPSAFKAAQPKKSGSAKGQRKSTKA